MHSVHQKRRLLVVAAAILVFVISGIQPRLGSDSRVAARFVLPVHGSDLPDIYVTSVDGSSLALTCAEDQERRRLRVCIGNQGTAATGPFSVALAPFHGTAVDSDVVWEVADIDSAQVACLTIPLFHSAVLHIDSTGAVIESDESNNTVEILLPTITRGPGCTPTPTPARPVACCEGLAGGCDAMVHPADCFRAGGHGYDQPSTCAPLEQGCAPQGVRTPTATPAPTPPDLAAGPVLPGSFQTTLGVDCPASQCMLACARNEGFGASPPFELSLGSYWVTSIEPLQPGDQSCVLAPRLERGRLIADRLGRVGELEVDNNAVVFELAGASTQTPTPTPTLQPDSESGPDATASSGGCAVQHGAGPAALAPILVLLGLWAITLVDKRRRSTPLANRHRNKELR